MVSIGALKIDDVQIVTNCTSKTNMASIIELHCGCWNESTACSLAGRAPIFVTNTCARYRRLRFTNAIQCNLKLKALLVCGPTKHTTPNRVNLTFRSALGLRVFTSKAPSRECSLPLMGSESDCPSRRSAAHGSRREKISRISSCLVSSGNASPLSTYSCRNGCQHRMMHLMALLSVSHRCGACLVALTTALSSSTCHDENTLASTGESAM